MSRSVRVLLAALAIHALAAPGAVVARSNASASRPELRKQAIMMFYGGTLHAPIVFYEEPPAWGLMPVIFGNSHREGSVADTAGRASIGLALFLYSNYPLTAESFAQLKPEKADRHGRFYPATGALKALLQLDDPRGVQRPIVVPDSTLAYLEKRGVPVRVPGK